LFSFVHSSECPIFQANYFKEGIGLVQDYDNQIKNELDVGKKAILEKNKQKEIKRLVSNIEKRGRIPLMDKSVRAHLRNIKNGEGTFKDAFSPNEFPLRLESDNVKCILSSSITIEFWSISKAFSSRVPLHMARFALLLLDTFHIV
jgi:hypothetical protein